MFETLTGEPIAVWMNYAVHPVNGYVVGVFSADYPGAACLRINCISPYRYP